MKRLTSKYRSRIADLIGGADATRETLVDGRVFLWRTDQDPETFAEARLPDADGGGERDSSDVPPIELANAAAEVLHASISIEVVDLVRETARLFGYQRVGRQIDEDLQQAIDLLVAQERGIRDGDRVVLPGG